MGWFVAWTVAAMAQTPSARCTTEAERLGSTASVSSGSGSGRGAAWEVTWTLGDAAGSEVALVESGGGGSIRSEVSFASHPTGAERTILFRCASRVDRADVDPDALARAPLLESAGAGSSPVAGVSVVAAPDVPWPVSTAALVPQRRSWTPSDARMPSEGQGSCPCWEVFDGTAFAPLAERRAGLARLGWPHADPPAGWVVWVTPHRNPTWAFGVLDGQTGRVRWVGLHFGPARPIGRHGTTTWIAGAAPMDDTGVSLYAVDPAATSIGRLTVRGARIPELDAVVVDEARGIPAESDDGQTVWLAWDLLERALAQPGTVLPAAR